MTQLLEVAQDPLYLTVILSTLGVVVWLLVSPQYTIEKKEELSKEEKEEIIKNWKPKPLVPPTFDPEKDQIDAPLLVESTTGPVILANGGQEYLNLASSNYLGLASLPDLKQEAREVITKYGVGSCGPRGFYGTIDLHLQLEKTMARFMGTEDAILYSDGVAFLSSVIPAFSKAGDFIVVDDSVNPGIQQGLLLSRSNITKFQHNDMKDLEAKLIENDSKLTPAQKTKHRRFIVVEGIYHSTGNLCPLNEVVRLANQYNFRIILDDSLAIGVLGATGRGSWEHNGLKVTDVDMICATLDASIASVGGICYSAAPIVNHQRLSGAGYCFSASQPPYTAKMATLALGYIDTNPELLLQLQKTTNFAYKTFSSILPTAGFEVLGDPLSPVVHLRVSKDSIGKLWPVKDQYDDKVKSIMRRVVATLRDEHNIVVSFSHRVPRENRLPHSIKLQTTVLHSDEDLCLAANTIVEVTKHILQTLPEDTCDLEAMIGQ